MLTSLLVATTLSGCADKQSELTKYSKDTVSAGFDTFITLVGYTKDEATFDQYFEQMKNEFIYYNKLFDRYNTYDDVTSLKEVNDNAGIKPVKVDQPTIDLLKLSQQFYELTDGQLDVTFGPVLEVWHNYRDLAELAASEGKPTQIPTMDELQRAQACTGMDKLVIDEAASTVYLSEPCASIDVGATAKGYAAELVAQSLEESGLTSGIINAGGNVRLIGTKPDAKPWTIGVQIPSDTTNGSLGNLKFNDDYSMVTSGDYQRYYEYNGARMHHIIDPKTLLPSAYGRSVTVVTENSGFADAMSTALYTMDYASGLALIQKVSEQLDIKIGAVWVFDQSAPAPQGVEVQEANGFQIVVSPDLKDEFELYK